jgi:nucleoside-diphosphate kinase
VERTLVIVTPDAVARCMVGRLLQRFEDTLLAVVALKLTWLPQDVAEAYCDELPICQNNDDSYYAAVWLLTQGPVVAIVLQGAGAVDKVRVLVGADSPHLAAAGTIRGDFAHHPLPEHATVAQLAHTSVSPEQAERQITMMFHSSELFEHRIAASYFAGPIFPPPPPRPAAKPSPVPRSLPSAADQPAGGGPLTSSPEQ